MKIIPQLLSAPTATYDESWTKFFAIDAGNAGLEFHKKY